MEVMERRSVGSSGVEISQIGPGGYELGPEAHEEPDVERAARVIAAASDSGINWLDTSENYLATRNEEVIGAALRHVSGEFLVASKVAPGAAITGGGSGFRREQVFRACEDSLTRLAESASIVSPMVVLRSVEEADIGPFFEHWSDDDALHMAAFTPADAQDRAAFEERWRRMRAEPSVLLRTIELDGRPVGSIGSWDNDGQREVTYWIGRAHWGNGIATDALHAFLALERTRPLHAACAADNLGSQRVLSKCSFRVVGSGRGYSNARNAEVDEVLLQLDE